MKQKISLLLVFAMILSFVPVAFAAEEAETLISVTNESVTTAGYTFEHTFEAAGTMTVTAGTCSPGYRYKVYGPGYESVPFTKWSTSHDHQVTAGDWKVVFYAYSSSEADNVAGTVSFDITFTATEGETEVQKAEYEVSTQALVLGDNAVTMLDTAVTTLFVFEPAETAVYTFTAPEGVILGYWGAGSWFLSDPGSTTNTYEWTCTGVGQTAYIGVSGVEGNVNINVEKTGEYTVVETPIVKYENKATLTAWEKPEGATWTGYVDVYGETHTAVLGDDGYYHLDSADGDVLVVNLKYQDIILSNALKSDRPVMYAYMTNEDGSQFKYDIGDAILEYEAVMDANGNYPVTEDIILFYQVYAMQAGTFTFHLSGNYNEDCVWMYCMRTMNMDNVETPEPSEPTEPSQPESSEPEVSEPTTPSEPEPSVPETEPTEPSEPVAGQVVLNESITAAAASKYVYTYKPAEDGTLTITVGDGSTTWSSDLVYFQGVTMKTVATANGSAATTYSAEVTANTSYRIRVWNNSGALAATPLTVVFTPAGGVTPEPSEPTEPSVPESSEPEVSEPTTPSEPEPTIPEPSEPVAGEVVLNESVTAASGSKYVYSYTPAEDGMLNITIGDGTTNWEFDLRSVVGLTFTGVATGKGSAQESFTADVMAGTKYQIRVWATSGALAETPITVVFAASGSTEPDPEEPEVQKDPYKVSTTKLNVGTNNLTMEETAEATIFQFRPTEAGKYTITGPEGSFVGIWGYSTAYLNNPNSTSNSFEWDCANVGPSIYVGILGAEGQVTLTVALEEVKTNCVAVYKGEQQVNAYTSMAEAINACQAGQHIVLLADVNENITVSGEKTIDLAGYALSGLHATGTVKLVDSTATYDSVKGAASVTGNVEMFTEMDGKTYLVVAQDGVYGAHPYAVELTHVSFAPSNDALGYKAKLYGDAVVQANVTGFGFNLWVEGGNVKTYEKTGTDTLTLRLKNILKYNGGEMPIHATAFVTFGGHIETTDQQTTTMKETLQAVDAQWDSYTDIQREAVKDLCDRYYATVSGWELNNIYPVTVDDTEDDTIVDIPITNNPDGNP